MEEDVTKVVSTTWRQAFFHAIRTCLALQNQFEVPPRYWSVLNPSYETDFLIQRKNDLFPIEVKSEDNTSSKSLSKFKEKYRDAVKLRIRFSLDNLKLDDDILNIPLFLADYTDQLIEMAL